MGDEKVSLNKSSPPTPSEPPEQAAEQEAQQRPGPARPPRRALARRLLRLAVLFGIAAGAALLLRAFVVAPYYVPSGSMEPTLHGCPGCDDDHILIDKISYRFHAPERGDIVVFGKPPDLPLPDPVLVKRVVGLPGDQVALRRGRVYVDGRRLAEPYLSTPFLRRHCGSPAEWTTPITARSHWTIPAGDVFVLGDYRCDSLDSRDFGPIPDSSIIGRVFAIFWPLGRLRVL